MTQRVGSLEADALPEDTGVGSLEEGAWPEEADAASLDDSVALGVTMVREGAGVASLDDGVALGAPVAREVADFSAVSRVTRFCMARVPISSAQPGCRWTSASVRNVSHDIASCSSSAFVASGRN